MAKKFSMMLASRYDVQARWRWLMGLIASGLVLSGCSYLQPDPGVDLAKQIERQQQMYELSTEPGKPVVLSVAEYEVLGDRFLQQGDINRAYLNYLKGLTQEPTHSSLLHKQAGLLLKKRKYGQAEQVYRKLLALTPDDALAHQGLGRALLGLNQLGQAEEAFWAGLTTDDTLWQCHHYLGLIHSGRQDYPRAVEQFKQALSLRPGEASVLNNLAVTYYLQQRYTEAEKILAVLARNNAQAKILNNLAITYVQLGKYQQALNAFKRGSASEAVAYNNIGAEYLARRKYQEAIAAFEQAIAHHPQFYPSAQANLEQARKALQEESAK